MAVLASCAERIVYNGFEELQEVEKTIIVGKDDKSTALKKIGFPNARSLDNSVTDEWYYVYKAKAYMTFLKPKIKEHLILRLVFDRNGKLIQKELLDNPEVITHKVREESTPVKKGKEGYLKDILGNFGYMDRKKDQSGGF